VSDGSGEKKRRVFRESLFGRRRSHARGGAGEAQRGGAPEVTVPRAIHVFHYTAEALEETDVQFAEDLARFRSAGGVTWVNVDGLGNPDLVREIGRVFDLHDLALEDVCSLRQRPKVEHYPTHLYVVMKALHYEEAFWTEQVSIFLGPGFVLTFHERPGDALEPVRERLRSATGPLRREGADYLLYAIVDAIVDGYFPFLERVGGTVEEVEDEVVSKPTRRTVGRIHEIKRDLFDVRRVAWPLRDALNVLLRDEPAVVGKTARLYLRDCYDHVVLVLDIVETYRDLVGSLTDVYISSIDLRMQEIMKVLTVIATIFMPLSFIAGVYGMNFRNMPELGLAWGYPAALALMALIAIVMLVWFHRKGWLRRTNDR
jgi:magnesium transporter